jgi:hypothetical protein
MIDKLLEELNRLQEAEALLKEIYSEIGPYNKAPIWDQTMTRLNKYFKFDDSE